MSLRSRSPLTARSGYDAPFHLSEECSNANIAAPRAIVLTSGVGGLFGWFLQLVVAYTVVDIDAALESDLGQPWASYLLQVLPQKAALAALSLTVIAAFSMGQGCMVWIDHNSFSGFRILADMCFRFRLLHPESRLLTPATAASLAPGGSVVSTSTPRLPSTLSGSIPSSVY